MKSPRRSHTAAFKAKVAIASLRFEPWQSFKVVEETEC